MGTKASDRANTRHIQHLLERVNAKEGHITATQLDRFVSRPYGAMLPKGCIEIRPIADFVGVHGLSHELLIREIVLDPSNRPCVLTVCDNHFIALHNGKLYTLHPVRLDDLFMKAQVIGFSEEMPVVRIDQFRDFASDDKPVCVFVWCGDQTIGLYDSDVISIVMRGNGELWHSCEREPGLCEVGHGHITELTVQGSDLQIAEDANGDLYLLWHGNSLGVQGYILSKRGWDGFQHLHLPKMVEPKLERLGAGVAVIHSNSAGVLLEYYSEEREARRIEQLCFDNYLRGYSYSSDGRFSYVAQKAGGECIRLDGKYLAIFDRVTPVFEKDGDLFYYATVDGYLFLMRTPK